MNTARPRLATSRGSLPKPTPKSLAQDLFALAGLALMVVGAAFVYAPAGLIVGGAGLWYLAIWWRPRAK